MSYLFSIIIIISIIFSIFSGSIVEINEVLLNVSYEALSSFLMIGCGMVLWSGIIEVAINGGFLSFFSRFLKPIIKLFFKTKDEETLDFIAINITSNILSLGTASTTFGLKAMERLAIESNHKESKDMVTLIVFNICGFTLFPTTLMSVVNNYGMDSKIIYFYVLLIPFSVTLIMLLINRMID